MIKKLVIFLLFLLILLPYSTGSSGIKKIKALATTTIIYDIAINIAGNKIEVNCLMPVGGDPHLYDPVPGDAQKVVESDVVLKNGLMLEGWLDEIIENAGGNRPIVVVTKGIKPFVSEAFHGSPDPHAWMDPILVIEFARNIKNTFIQLDAKNAGYYTENFTRYKQELIELDSYIKNNIYTIPEQKRVLITSHDAFRYYGSRYGVRVEALMGISTDAEVQIGDVNNIINVIKTTGISAIFMESTINPKLLRQLAKDHGVVIGGKLFADSLGDEESGADTYLKMLKQNTDTIVTALTMTGNRNTERKRTLLPLFIAVGLLFGIGFLWVFLKIKQIAPNSTQSNNWDHYNIDINKISVSYQRKTVLSNITLSIESGKLYGLIGPNGAGKSTLLKSILGLIPIDNGCIKINGRSIDEVRDKIAYIPQKEEIDWAFPATVEDIVITGRLPHKRQFERFNSDDRSICSNAMETVGISEYVDRQISDLSGGQQQRVFIARALCQQAEILLFDEPFVGVDIKTEEKIVQIIKDLAQQNKTIVLIQHDLAKVKDYFDYVIMLNQWLIAFGKTKDVFTQQNITATYAARLTILQETEKYVYE
ncbi:MAG: ATP-binding cassette domain-containing protein [Cytophagales bacterium]|nr:ATP-binding cassette domain-containing protein [Cytophagales bacterium]